MNRFYKIIIKTGLILFICWVLLNTTNLFAQQGTVKGVIKDASGETVIGASVVLKGTTVGTITDIDGNYTLSHVYSGAVIVFSFIGYETQEILYTGKNEINVTLTEANQNLNEVVVIGYGVVKKSDATGSVIAIKPDELNKGLAVNPQDMLQE